MKKLYTLLLMASCLFSCTGEPKKHTETAFQNGDFIFQTSTSLQSQAIQLATKSKYSHCGLLFNEGGKWFVYEAIQPVSMTPLDEWIKRGKDSHYVVKRLKDTDKALTTANLKKMKSASKKMAGKNYDLYFGWSDDRIYCSELIWKIYKEGTGLEIGKLQHLKDFDLSHPTVQQKLKERYGNNIPKNEKVISPVAIFESNLLYTVTEN